MQRTLILILALTTACAPGEEAAQDTAPAALTLSDFAGTWYGTATPVESNTVAANVEMLATSTPDGWSFTVVSAANPAQASTTPARVVAFEGDSVILEAGPFPSTLRPGEMVSTRSVYRLQNDSMVGVVQATYPSSGETVTFNSTATRRR